MRGRSGRDLPVAPITDTGTMVIPSVGESNETSGAVVAEQPATVAAVMPSEEKGESPMTGRAVTAAAVGLPQDLL